MSKWIKTNGKRPDLPEGTEIYVRHTDGWEGLAVIGRTRDWDDRPVSCRIVAYRLATEPKPQMAGGIVIPEYSDPRATAYTGPVRLPTSIELLNDIRAAGFQPAKPAPRWLPCTTPPQRPGVYQRRVTAQDGSWTWNGFQFWSGEHWCGGQSTAEEAAKPGPRSVVGWEQGGEYLSPEVEQADGSLTGRVSGAKAESAPWAVRQPLLRSSRTPEDAGSNPARPAAAPDLAAMRRELRDFIGHYSPSHRFGYREV